MGIIQKPSPGQLIDHVTITNMIDALNRYEAERNSLSNNSAISEPVTNNVSIVQTSKTVFFAGYAEISNQQGTVGNKVQTVNFQNVSFRYAPIVTVTPVSIKGGAKATDVSVGVESVGRSSVDIIVNFKSSTATTVGVNIIAVGISSS